MKNDNLLKHIQSNLKRRHTKLYNITLHDNILLKKCSRLEQIFFNYAKLITFNKYKSSNLFLNFEELGVINLIKKIYSKNIEIKLIELKSIHLNTGVFSSAIALKLRDRKNKAVRVLRKAILQMVKIPDLHTPPPSSTVHQGLLPFLRGYWWKSDDDRLAVFDGEAIIAAMPKHNV